MVHGVDRGACKIAAGAPHGSRAFDREHFVFNVLDVSVHFIHASLTPLFTRVVTLLGAWLWLMRRQAPRWCVNSMLPEEALAEKAAPIVVLI